MRPITVIALAAIAGLLTSQLPATAAEPAPTPDQVEVVNSPDLQSFQLVGFTSAKFDGDETRFGFTRACHTEFGPASRMCRAEEVIETVAIPEGLWGTAWADPDAESPFSQSDCGQWTLNGTGTSGTAVDSGGRVRIGICAVRTPVACCAPVP